MIVSTPSKDRRAELVHSCKQIRKSLGLPYSSVYLKMLEKYDPLDLTEKQKEQLTKEYTKIQMEG